MGGRGGNSGFNEKRPTTTRNYIVAFHDEKAIDWIKEKMSISDEAARDTFSTLKEYFDDATSVHNRLDRTSERKIEKFLTSPNVPVYEGETYRGVSLNPTETQSAKEVIESIIKKGVWREPGITSFTSDRRQPLEFADHKDRRPDAIPVLLVNENNIAGVPVGHLSQAFQQREVMYPARIARKGFRIISHEIIKMRSGKDLYVLRVSEK